VFIRSLSSYEQQHHQDLLGFTAVCLKVEFLKMYGETVSIYGNYFCVRVQITREWKLCLKGLD